MLKPTCFTDTLVFLLFLGTGMASAATSVPITFDSLVRQSDYVVYGRVVANRSYWEPATGAIWTQTTFLVLDRPKGGSGSTILISEPGGTVGSVGHLIPGIPRFETNQEVVLFLYNAPGRHIRVLGLQQGIYRVALDPATGARVANPLLQQRVAVYSEGLTLSHHSHPTPVPRRLSEFLYVIREKAGAR